MAYCKSCWSEGRGQRWYLKPECWNKYQQIYLLTCTNPAHVYSIWRKLYKGWWYPVELSKQRQSTWTSSGIEYRSGGVTRKIKESHLRDIRSRKHNEDGSVTRKSSSEDNKPLVWEE